MLPDLRLVIVATLSTFLVSGAAGLYASFRLTQDPLTVRTETHASGDENPITRISVNWPMPEPGREAALRSLNALEKTTEGAQTGKSGPAQSASQATLPEPPTGSIFEYKNSETSDTKMATRPQPSAVETIPARTSSIATARKKRAERTRVRHRRVIVQQDMLGTPGLNGNPGLPGAPGFSAPPARAQTDAPAPFFFFNTNGAGS